MDLLLRKISRLQFTEINNTYVLHKPREKETRGHCTNRGERKHEGIAQTDWKGNTYVLHKPRENESISKCLLNWRSIFFYLQSNFKNIFTPVINTFTSRLSIIDSHHWKEVQSKNKIHFLKYFFSPYPFYRSLHSQLEIKPILNVFNVYFRVIYIQNSEENKWIEN